MAVPNGKPFSTAAPTRHYKPGKAPKVTQTNAATEKVGGSVHRTAPADAAQHRKTGALQYVALRPMKVNGVKVQAGDLVPAASSWRNVHNYVSTGHLAVVGA